VREVLLVMIKSVKSIIGVVVNEGASVGQTMWKSRQASESIYEWAGSI